MSSEVSHVATRISACAFFCVLKICSQWREDMFAGSDNLNRLFESEDLVSGVKFWTVFLHIWEMHFVSGSPHTDRDTSMCV